MNHETILGRRHVVDVGGIGFPVINHTLKAVLLASAGTPTTTGLADEERAIRKEARTHRSGVKTTGKRHDTTLIDAIELFGLHPQHRRESLIANEHLLLEGAELFAGHFPGRMPR